MVEITQAQTAADFQAFQELVAELGAWDREQSSQLGLDADDLMAFFYNQPVSEVAAEFAPPAGRIFLATFDGEIGGCAALRKFGEGIGELKRFYVPPALRGKGIGRALLEALIAEARYIGYSTLWLETAVFMKDAHKLYHSVGFNITQPYVDVPEDILPFEVFMELSLE